MNKILTKLAGAILTTASGRESFDESQNLSILSIFSLIRNLCHTVLSLTLHNSHRT